MKSFRLNELRRLYPLWKIFSTRLRIAFILLTILMVVAAALEALTIGAILPLLSALTDPNFILEVDHPFKIDWLPVASDQENLRKYLIGAFAALALCSGLLRLILIRLIAEIAFRVGSRVGEEAYAKTIVQPVAFHDARDSSEIVNAVTTKSTTVIYGTVLPILDILSLSVILIGLTSVVIFIDPFIAGGVFISIGFTYWLFFSYSKPKINESGSTVAQKSNQLIQTVKESHGLIREILLYNLQGRMMRTFTRQNRQLRSAQKELQWLASCPRYIFETAGLLAFSAAAYFLSSSSDKLLDAVPTLGAIAFGAQRMLPTFQQIYANFVALNGNWASYKDVLDLLKLPSYESEQRQTGALNFESEIRFRDVSFKYEETREPILENINFSIRRGQRVCILGGSGEGKSTLLDIILGLKVPDAGFLTVDGVLIEEKNIGQWQQLLACVSQEVFLMNNSVLANVSFEEMDTEPTVLELRRACSLAQAESFIEGLARGYHTQLGENGATISGGQKQRLGLARAIYRELVRRKTKPDNNSSYS